VRTVRVEVAPRPYDVLVGAGVRHELMQVIAAVAPAAKMAILVTQQSLVDAGWTTDLATGLAQYVLVIGDGEDAKSMATVETLLHDFVRLGLSRHDVVVAVGGGMVSDVAGFAAAIFHRGVGYVTVATTLLAQVDAAIGGKTGVNLEEGKNLVGAFHQPLAVLADTDLLATLPPREVACGRGEMAKYAFLDVGKPSVALLSYDLDEQVAHCAEIKARVVANDERETGLRMTLNYGHTLAHALEAVGLDDRAHGRDTPSAQLAHGEAVAIGLVFAARLARALDRIDDERVELHERVVQGFDLSTQLPSGLRAQELIELMARDKKAHHDLTFVLDGVRGVEPVRSIDPVIVATTLVEMGADS
jgi:5-deoxy-5-amino-3-dehydroquinate synthase